MSFSITDVSPLGVATEFYRAYTMAFTYSERIEKAGAVLPLACEYCDKEVDSFVGTKCDHPGCNVYGHIECLNRCECHSGVGKDDRYCDEHLVRTDLCGDGKDYPTCFACMKEIECDEAEAA